MIKTAALLTAAKSKQQLLIDKRRQLAEQHIALSRRASLCIAHQVMGVHHSIVILLLVLCASLSTYGQTEEVKERYKKFIRQHVFGTMNVQRCDSEIRTRRITGSQNDNSCKGVNTFILANNKQVKAVCTGGGTRLPEKRDLYMSNKPFPVVTCTLIGGERHPKCEYRGHRSTRRIVVGCAGDWPTHYEEGIIV